MTLTRLLLVEGNDDLHVIWALLAHHDFPETFEVEDKRGIDNLFRSFPVHAKGSGIEAIGIVIDADVDAAARWTRVRAAIRSLGYNGCPDALPPEGLVLNEADLPRIGAWIMPDNTVPGMLEDFIAVLVPPEDGLWAHAQVVLGEFPEGLAKYNNAHGSKAQIHTWLAWQEEPGTPMGLAITKKWLDPESQSALPFLQWLRRMFVE